MAIWTAFPEIDEGPVITSVIGNYLTDACASVAQEEVRFKNQFNKPNFKKRISLKIKMISNLDVQP